MHLKTKIPGNPYATAVERVMWMRAEYDIGMAEAKLLVWKDDMLYDIAQAEDVADLKAILTEIVNAEF